ncbi:MAG TPA: hypothetical protein VHG69_10840, partial [Thermoleophilaceae bacterium]|nr:hypothetical protein [Thermoleophilaceae bacterium]
MPSVSPITAAPLSASGTQELGALSLWAPSSGGGDITATARNTVFRATSSGPFADVIVDADPGTSITLDATHSAYTTLFTED